MCHRSFIDNIHSAHFTHSLQKAVGHYYRFTVRTISTVTAFSKDATEKETKDLESQQTKTTDKARSMLNLPDITTYYKELRQLFGEQLDPYLGQLDMESSLGFL